MPKLSGFYMLGYAAQANFAIVKLLETIYFKSGKNGLLQVYGFCSLNFAAALFQELYFLFYECN